MAECLDPAADTADLWAAGLPGVELFQARLLHHSFGKHFHETYTLGLNDCGLGSFSQGGETRWAPPRHLNLLAPGEVHTGQARAETGWAFRDLYLSVPLVDELLMQLQGKRRGPLVFVQPVVADLALRQRFEQLFAALSEPVPAPLAAQSLLLALLARLLERHVQAPVGLPPLRPEPAAIARCRAYLEAHYAAPISLTALAEVAGLSPAYLVRSFHRQVGLPPHRYQRQWQLLQAKQALRSPLPLAEIALAHGFYDQSHLNRHFKRAFGLTPGQYRQRNSVQDGPG